MPTTLPRHSVTFARETNEILGKLADERGVPIATLISDMVTSALSFIEDFELARLGEERIKSFRRDQSLTTEQVLAWNAKRKK